MIIFKIARKFELKLAVAQSLAFDITRFRKLMKSEIEKILQAFNNAVAREFLVAFPAYASDLSVTVLTDPTMTPLNNFDLDYVAGWVGTFTFEVDQYSVCAIPVEPIIPVTNQCQCDPSTVELVNTLETVLLTESIDCGTTEQIIAPDATLQIKKENDGTIHVEAVPSGVTETYFVLDNDLTVNGANPFSIHATDPLDIRLRDQHNNVITPISVIYNGNSNHVTIQINV